MGRPYIVSASLWRIPLYSPTRNVYILNMTAPNFSKGAVWVGDNLHVMRGINSANALTFTG